MYCLANRDIELSCDAWVIRMMGEKNRSSYALMLIKMEERRNGMSALCSHFGKNAISERIEAIMKFKKDFYFSLRLCVGFGSRRNNCLCNILIDIRIGSG